jgi:hypothetical protein
VRARRRPLEGRAAMESDTKTHRPPKALRAKLTGDAWFRQLPGEVPLNYFLIRLSR